MTVFFSLTDILGSRSHRTPLSRSPAPPPKPPPCYPLTMNQPKSAFTEDDDDIGVLIYQHAKREVENSAAALSQETDRTHRRSARITRTVALTKAASHATVQSQKPVRIARSTNPIKSKPYKLNATDSKQEVLGWHATVNLSSTSKSLEAVMCLRGTNQILNWESGL